MPTTEVKTYKDSYCQAIACTCETSKTIITLVYRPPNAETRSTKNMFEFLNEYISEINKGDEYDVLSLGDFNLPNISWPTTSLVPGYPSTTNDAADALMCFMNDHFLNQHVEAPTRQSNVLDLCLTNNDTMIMDISVHDTALSDHRIVEILLADHPAYAPITTPKDFEDNSFRCLNLPKADWTKVKKKLRAVDWDMLYSMCETEEEFPELFRLTLLQICLLEIPKKPDVKKDYKPSGSRACRVLGRKKRKLQTRLKATQANPRCRAAADKIKTQLILIQVDMRDAINGEIDLNERNAVKKMKDNPKYFYTYAKQFLKRKPEIKLLMDENLRPIFEKKGIADVFQIQYTSVQSDPHDPKKKDPSFPTASPVEPMTDKDLEFTEADIIKAIDEIKAHAASGPDEIPIQVLKNCKDILAEPIYLIWKHSLKNGTVPACYKESIVTPIHKKGSKVEAKNYRPVSLTSHIIKIFERVLREKIVHYLETNGLICNIQHGFRKGHSCLSELLDHIDDIMTGLTDSKDTDVIYLDYAKAFDKVDHDLLLKKLRKYGIHEKVIDWIQSFLSDRTQTVVINGVHSFIAIIISGVPQGTVLGPILFIIFINDIGGCVKHSIVRCFADDTRLSGRIDIAEDCTHIQEDLLAITTWSEENNMVLHEDKFEYLSHKCRKTLLDHLPFATEYSQYDTKSGVTIYPSDQVRDLGVIVSSDLSWDNHINSMLQKAKMMSAWVLNVFKCRDSCTMLTLYKSLIRSLLEYCCPLWHPTTIGLTQKIEALQRSFTRKISGCQDMNYWERLSHLKLMSLQRRRERYIIITMWKILNNRHPNNMNIQFNEPNRSGITAKLPRLSNPKMCNARHQTMFDSSFKMQGPKLWNLIPAKITLISDLEEFKIGLYDNFLSKKPDRPPVRGYTCANFLTEC